MTSKNVHLPQTSHHISLDDHSIKEKKEIEFMEEKLERELKFY